VVLLEFCAAQREERGGLSAEVMRGDIAERSGLTIDRVDDCNRVLEQAGLLEIARRRAANGGRHLPSLYTIHEAPTGAFQRGETELTARANGSGSPVEEYYQGGALVPPARVNGTGSAASRYRQRGDTAMTDTASPPSNARAGLEAEKDIEDLSSLHGVSDQGERGEEMMSAEQLCEALVGAWEPALGAAPADDFAANRARWLDAATSLVSRHTRPRLEQALGYMVTDEILGSQALTMNGFAKVADQLIARAYARRQRLAIRSAPQPKMEERLGWEDAKQRLQRAIQRHGREGRESALRELGEHSPLLVRFVEQVRWGSLCEQPFQYVERRYAEVWRELVEHSNEQGGERAA
jgi:hypothetical protein